MFIVAFENLNYKPPNRAAHMTSAAGQNLPRLISIEWINVFSSRKINLLTSEMFSLRALCTHCSIRRN